jgi:hypothetical protein
MKNKNIRNYNHNGEYHGYQEFYENNELWLRSYYKNGIPIGYIEINTSEGVIGNEGTLVFFHIK